MSQSLWHCTGLHVLFSNSVQLAPNTKWLFSGVHSSKRHRSSLLEGPLDQISALEPEARSPVILLTGALILFWLLSPEPKEIFRVARNPAFWNLIIRVLRLRWFLFTAFLCLFVHVKGTVSWLSYFITFCQILAMKLDVCKEITTMDLNDKTIAS